MFDNGALCSLNTDHLNRTRIAEYALDEENMTAELVFSYRNPDIYSSTMGSAQRLPNGNTVVGWGGSGQAPQMVTELDPDGNVIFELEGYAPHGEIKRSYRARRFEE
jgi:hypothetical protein